MKKGFTEATEQMVEWIGLIVICMVMLYVIISWASAGSHVQKGIEQGSLMYTIASSANALSTMEEGEIVRNLRSYFDIEVSCDGECNVRTAVYDQSGNRQKESNEILILGGIEPVSMEMVNKITLTKAHGEDKVNLAGERTEDIFGTELVVKEYSPMCLDKNARYRDLIRAASAKYGVEEEVIASIVIAESNWDPNAVRYEPGFQIRYLEGSSYANSNYWIKEGDQDYKTINQWFSENPDRAGEKSGLSGSLDIAAQTKVSSSYGLMQIMYTTAYETCGFRGTPDDLKKDSVNIDCGTKVLKTKMDRYSGLPNAVSAYNAGSPAWQSNLANRRYTEKVLGLYNAFKACPA